MTTPDQTTHPGRQRKATLVVIAAAGAMITAAVGLILAGHLYWPVYLFLAAMLTLLALATGRFAWRLPESHPRLRSTIQGLWMSALTVAILLMGLEAFCRAFVAWSDGFVVTLSERSWLRRHWQPINSLGYRDPEWSEEALAGRTRVLAIGDSVTAGAGLEDIDERYQNQLAGMLGDRYAVMTAAQIGWDSREELAALESYPYPPDVVILCYSVNDIDTVAAEHGVTVTPGFSLRDSPVFPLISTSHFLNFAYYSILRLPAWGSDGAVRVYQRQAYSDPVVWEEQTRLLQAFADWSKDHNARLVVMVMPDLNSAASTSPYTRQVGEFFAGQGDVTVLDLGPELSGRDARQMAISAMDAHPNAATQHLFALKLCPVVAGLGGLPPVSCPQSP